MHQYIIYLFIIFGSVSVVQGCDNANNNNASTKLLCTLCTKEERYAKKHGKEKGILSDETSYIVHFNRYHWSKYEQSIKALPKGNGDRTKFRLQFAQKIEQADISPVTTPEGSPIISHHDTIDTMSDIPAETEREKSLHSTKKIFYSNRKKHKRSPYSPVSPKENAVQDTSHPSTDLTFDWVEPKDCAAIKILTSLKK